MTSLNPTTKEREFNGTPGAVGITLGLPLLISFFGLIINDDYLLQGVNLDIQKVLGQLPVSSSEWFELAFDTMAWKAYLAWFFGLAVLDLILPGQHLNGVQLRDGTSLPYKINGLAFSGLLIALLASRYYTTQGQLPELQFLYNNQLKLTIVAIIFSYGLSTFLYLYSFVPLLKPNGLKNKERILALGGNTGNIIYDFFIGRELNPRIGPWDLKLFCELKPGLFLWLLINLSCLHQQYLTTGSVNDSLLLVNLLQGFYIFDGVLNEEGVLSMMDITTDGFGFMLVFGDLAWVPWAYSVQARFLTYKSVELGPLTFGAIILVSAVGYYIFHESNKQKSQFRSGKLDHLKLNYIQTERGTKLLADGWWKRSQHINYFGDWIIAWSWCLPTAFNTPLTYFYVIYFGVLLLHRQARDEAKCREKYGKSWEKYETLVPYKIIPYVY